MDIGVQHPGAELSAPYCVADRDLPPPLRAFESHLGDETLVIIGAGRGSLLFLWKHRRVLRCKGGVVIQPRAPITILTGEETFCFS